MRLHLLRNTPCLSIYYDTHNDWLFLDWKGELSLADVQVACLEISRCFMQRAYPRVLNSNLQVTGVSWSIVSWLALEFMPHLSMAGVEHLAWVCAPSLWGRTLVQRIANLLPKVTFTLFDDVTTAADWLQHTRLESTMGYILPQRPPSTQAKLAQQVERLKQQIVVQQQRQPRW
jgi:hypothetical protein